jgi:glutathione S-transferase
MTMYKLHSFKESGNSYKVALALSMAGADWEMVQVEFFKSQTRQPAWRADINEMGEVPVLEFEGRRMTQSGAILLYLSEQVDFLRLQDDERNEVIRWLLFDNHKFTANLASYRWLRTFTYPAAHEAVLTFMRQRTMAALDIVNRRLVHSTFIVGDHLTIADLSLAGYVYYPTEELGFDLRTDYPHLGQWMARMEQVPGWREPYELLA